LLSIIKSKQTKSVTNHMNHYSFSVLRQKRCILKPKL